MNVFYRRYIVAIFKGWTIRLKYSMYFFVFAIITMNTEVVTPFLTSEANGLDIRRRRVKSPFSRICCCLTFSVHRGLIFFQLYES